MYACGLPPGSWLSKRAINPGCPAQAHLYACGLGKASSADLPPRLRGAAGSGLARALAEDMTRPRNTQRSVANALQGLGMSGRLDAQLANGLWDVHILLAQRDRNQRPVRGSGAGCWVAGRGAAAGMGWLAAGGYPRQRTACSTGCEAVGWPWIGRTWDCGGH